MKNILLTILIISFSHSLLAQKKSKSIPLNTGKHTKLTTRWNSSLGLGIGTSSRAIYPMILRPIMISWTYRLACPI